MGLIDRWKSWTRWRTERTDPPERHLAARRFGHRLGRDWLDGRDSTLRVLTPGAGDSLVAAAFRHGLVEGESLRDAGEVAHAVLSGFVDAARRRARGGRAATPCQDSALRGVAWMAHEVRCGSHQEYRLGASTVEKVRGWRVERSEATNPSCTRRKPGAALG